MIQVTLCINSALFNMRGLIILCLLPLALATLDIDKTADGPRVQTPLGGIRGFYDYSLNGRKYMAFEGIPYAQMPVGDLRFRVSTLIFII